jgi:hypothetical protein
VKYDGYRLRLERDGKRVRLITKGGMEPVVPGRIYIELVDERSPLEAAIVSIFIERERPKFLTWVTSETFPGGQRRSQKSFLAGPIRHCDKSRKANPEC